MASIALPAQEVVGQDAEEPSVDEQQVAEQGDDSELEDDAAEANARREEAALNEDPEAQLRSMVQEDPDYMDKWPSIHLYGSVRLHAINNFNEQNEATEFSLGDGASRVGVRYDWEFTKDWYLFGRAEGGFDVLETFTPNGNNDGEDGVGLTSRLLYGGITSENLVAVWGKNWSSYYQIAGMADRFSIFGGQAVGIYNAGTDGGATGTGRADNVLQARIYTSALRAIRIKPFNLNLQYQQDEPIPRVENRNYGKAFGASAWLESQKDQGIGLAWHQADIENLEDPVIREAGISGDASAIALAFRKYGENWYGALVVARMENIQTTDQFKYFDGYGAELYLQWQFGERWWMISGGNWSKPDGDDPDAGEYEIAYAVLGLRYTLDSFNRMLYAEYRMDFGDLWDGTDRKNELTIGFRWDFGY
jgi:hypothetical protein